MRKVIVFRGRNTANVIHDARNADIIRDGDEVVIVCRKGDALAEPGDVTTPPTPHWGVGFDYDPVTHIVVCNGGTTAQVVPYVYGLGRLRGDQAAAMDEVHGDHYGKGTTPVVLLDVQRDGITILAGDASTLSRG